MNERAAHITMSDVSGRMQCEPQRAIKLAFSSIPFPNHDGFGGCYNAKF